MQLTISSHTLRGRSVRLPFSHPAWLSLTPAGSMKRAPARRARFYTDVGVTRAPVYLVDQCHSTTVLVAPREANADANGDNDVDIGTGDNDDTGDRERELGRGDGIVCAAGGGWLGVGVGDCLPIFLADPVTGAYGLLHSGWEGTGILAEGVRTMQNEFGSDPGDLVVLLGPGIQASDYPVDAARSERFRQWGDAAVITHGGRTHLDLYEANREIARRVGVKNVVSTTNSTFTNVAFGSYRRQGSENYCGMLALIGPTEKDERNEGLPGGMER